MNSVPASTRQVKHYMKVSKSSQDVRSGGKGVELVLMGCWTGDRGQIGVTERQYGKSVLEDRTVRIEGYEKYMMSLFEDLFETYE